jgi:arginine/ornithine transport system permease protein
MIDFSFIMEHFPMFFGAGEDTPIFSLQDGLLITLKLLVVSLWVGFMMALPIAWLSVQQSKILSWPAHAWMYLIRGTPMLVQLFIIYYGLSQFDWLRKSFAWNYLQDAYTCAWIALAFNTSAYTAEIIAGQLKESHTGELEAAQALGMSSWQSMIHILIPAALRRALPAYSNEVIMMLHGTALASTVTLADLTGVARTLYSETYVAFEPFLMVASIYLVLSLLFVLLFRSAERHYLAYLKPKKSNAVNHTNYENMSHDEITSSKHS